MPLSQTELDKGALNLVHIDEFANSTGDTTTSPDGVQRQTLDKYERDISAAVNGAASDLNTFKAGAEQARDDAQAAANAIAATVIGGRRADTWAGTNGLSTITGLQTGAPGEVTLDATGTHTDPVTAATVPNQGKYRYVSPTGWQWVGTLDDAAVRASAAALADEVSRTTDDGQHYIAASPQTQETLLAINPATGRMWGSAVDLLGIRRPEPWREFSRRLASVPTTYTSGEGWNHSIIWGQSNALGSADSAPVLTPTASYYNLTFNGGVRADGTGANPWTATKALGEQVDGINGESSASGLAEAAVAYAVRRMGVPAASNINFVSVVGQGATAITGLVKGSAVYTRLLDHVTQAKALATAAGKQYNCNIIFAQEGETAALTGMARSTYVSTGLQLIADANADIKAIKVPQDDVHVVWSQCSYYVTNGVDTNIALAQLDLTHQSPRAHVLLPTYVLPHDEDDTHRTGPGHKLEGLYEGRAAAQLRAGHRPDNLEPTSAYVVNGTELHIRFAHVPTYPLVLDITYRTKVQDFGVKIVDASGTLTLSNHQISEAGDEFVCTLDRALAGNPRCRIGLDYLPWDMSSSYKGITNGAITNIRDSTSDPVVVDGVTYDRAHWALHAELPIDVLTGEL